MGANLDITEKLQNYINNFGLNLHPVQQEIIDYNKTLGDIKRMQIDPTQCHFLHLIIKVSNIKNVLEIRLYIVVTTGSSVSEQGCISFALTVPHKNIWFATCNFKYPLKLAFFASITFNLLGSSLRASLEQTR